MEMIYRKGGAYGTKIFFILRSGFGERRTLYQGPGAVTKTNDRRKLHGHKAAG
jgi:hypothetical protein